MKPYEFQDFTKSPAWLIFRVDTQIKEQSIDVYILMELPSGSLHGYVMVPTELSQAEADTLLNQGKSNGSMPCRVILAAGDPAETVLRNATKTLGMDFESVPAPYLEELIAPVKQTFGQHIFSPSSIGYTPLDSDIDELDRESAKQMIPDSYDPCPCASGKKYKFCCKPIFLEIMEAMVAAEQGRLSEALDWLAKAKVIVGESAEVLCREAIVYSFFDPEKYAEMLDKCLTTNPHHPRAHYLRGLKLKEEGDLLGAVNAYETAITFYPPSDHFHLNEVYNNLGTAFYDIGDLIKAKSAWEKALLFMPSDKMARRNLAEFIYNNHNFRRE